jgi:hypothetical protein
MVSRQPGNLATRKCRSPFVPSPAFTVDWNEYDCCTDCVAGLPTCFTTDAMANPVMVADEEMDLTRELAQDAEYRCSTVANLKSNKFTY